MVVSRRLVFVVSVLATGISSFTLGVMHARRSDKLVANAYDAKIDAIRAEVHTTLGRATRNSAVAQTAGTSGRAKDDVPNAASRARMVAEIKQELQSEMG